MFTDRTFRDAQKRKKNWIELKKHQNLLNRVDELEQKLSSLDQELDRLQETMDDYEISRFKEDRLQDN